MTFYYGLVITLYLEYIRPGVDIPVIAASKIPTILPLTLFVASLFVATKHSHGVVFSHANIKWLLFFFLLIILSVLTADVTSFAFTRFEQALGYLFVFYMIARYVDDFDKLKGILKTICFIHIYLIIRNSDLILNPETRHYVVGAPFLGDGNDFSLSLCITFAMCLFLWLDASTKKAKLFYLGLLILITLAIIGTQSRGATLGLASILGYLWWESRNKMIGLIAVAILIVAALLFAPPQYFERMQTLQNYEEESSAMGRIDAWTHATEMAVASPIIGIGAGHFGMRHGLSAHSMYFLALAELGFPGIFFILAYLFTNFKRNARRMKEIGKDPPSPLRLRYRRLFLCLNGSLLGFAVSGTFLSVLYYPHIYVLGAIWFCAHVIYLREIDKEDAEAEPATTK